MDNVDLEALLYAVLGIAMNSGGGSGSVSIDSQTIIRDANNALKTAMGGYHTDQTSTDVVNGEFSKTHDTYMSRALITDTPLTGTETLTATVNGTVNEGYTGHEIVLSNATMQFQYAQQGEYQTNFEGGQGSITLYTSASEESPNTVEIYLKSTEFDETLSNANLRIQIVSPAAYHPCDGRFLPIDGTTVKLDANNRLTADCDVLKQIDLSWCGLDYTAAQVGALLLADSTNKVGDGFYGEVMWSDINALGLSNAEVTAFILSSSMVEFRMVSTNVSPYTWFYIYTTGGTGEWKTYVPISNVLTSTSTVQALSANMGKYLKDLIDAEIAKTVHYDADTGKTDAQKEQARNNIAAMKQVAVTAADNGKVLKVVDGVWAAVSP